MNKLISVLKLSCLILLVVVTNCEEQQQQPQQQHHNLEETIETHAQLKLTCKDGDNVCSLLIPQVNFFFFLKFLCRKF